MFIDEGKFFLSQKIVGIVTPLEKFNQYSGFFDWVAQVFTSFFKLSRAILHCGKNTGRITRNPVFWIENTHEILSYFQYAIT